MRKPAGTGNAQAGFLLAHGIWTNHSIQRPRTQFNLVGAEASMCRLCTLAVIAAALWMMNTPSQAAGSCQKRPPFDHLVIGGVPTPKVTLPPLPQINPGQVLGGCGRGRIRDPQTNSCRGPGNIGR
jgi:hypothetical protein